MAFSGGCRIPCRLFKHKGSELAEAALTPFQVNADVTCPDRLVQDMLRNQPVHRQTCFIVAEFAGISDQSTNGSDIYVLDMFSFAGHRDVMSDTSPLRLATADEITDALSFALRYHGRKRVNHADDIMARITADRLVQHLARSGFVLMKTAPAAAPSTSMMPPAGPR